MRIIMMFLFFPLLVFGQGKEKVLTNAEEFNLRSGTLIAKQFIDVGDIRKLKVRVIKYKDLNSDISQSALQLELKVEKSYGSDSKVASLDLDEIDDLIKSIKNLQVHILPSKPDVYTEVTYRSKSGFQAGSLYEVSKSKWVSYLQLEKYGDDSFVVLTSEELQTLLNLIEQAKLKL